MSNLSLMNPGTSINFDGQALQSQQEDEYQREEDEQQDELRQLLTNALDDLMDDEDLLSVSSNDGGSRTSSILEPPDKEPRTRPVSHWVQNTHTYPGTTSTPISGAPPALHTPEMENASTDFNHQDLGQTYRGPKADNVHGNFQLIEKQKYYSDHVVGNAPVKAGSGLYTDSDVDGHKQQPNMYAETVQEYNYPMPNSIENYGNVHMDNNVQYQPMENEENHQQIEGYPHMNYHDANKEDYHGDMGVFQHNAAIGDGQDYYYQTHNVANAPLGRQHDEVDRDSNQEGNPHQYNLYHQGIRPAGFYKETLDTDADRLTYNVLHGNNIPNNDFQGNTHSEFEAVETTDSSNKLASETVSLPQNTRGIPDDYFQSTRKPVGSPRKSEFNTEYKVQYRRNMRNIKQAENITTDDNSPVIDKEFIDVKVPEHSGSAEGKQFSQLQILYKARGRKLEELTSNYEILKQDMAREIRLLKHQLAVMLGEKEGSALSLKESQELLQQEKEENITNTGRLQVSNLQIQSLNGNKDELVKKLQTAESTIENLNQQLIEIAQSDSLARTRHEHDSVVNGIQQKYEREILALKEKLDVINSILTDKNKEVASLHEQVTTTVRSSENANISRAETINRLTKSLEESQRQCQKMLENSSSQELSLLKVHLQHVSAGKALSEDMRFSLQGEVNDLKEQMGMFESASRLGLFSQMSSTRCHDLLDDSITDLGIKKTLDFKTPDSNIGLDSMSNSENLVTNLRSELERCLLSNREKRAQLGKITEDLSAIQNEAKELRERCERAEKTAYEQQFKLKEFEDLLSSGDPNSIVEARLKKDIANLLKEKDILLRDIEDLKIRLDEVASNEEKVTEINLELKQQIKEMMQDFDSDKRIALNKCHEMSEQLHEDSKTRLREEMLSQFKDEKSEVVCKYEIQLSTLRSDLEKADAEVDGTKELYVRVCGEKEQMESALRREYEASTRAELEKMKEILATEKSEKAEQHEASLEANKEVVRMRLQEECLSHAQEEIKTSVDAQVAMAKIDWFDEQQVNRQAAIENAVKAAETKWTRNSEENIEKQVEMRIVEAKEAWINEKRVLFEEELQRRILLGAEENEQKFEEEKRTILENAKEEQDTVEQQLRKQVAETKYAKQQMETKNEEAVRKLHVELEEAKSSIAVQTKRTKAEARPPADVRADPIDIVDAGTLTDQLGTDDFNVDALKQKLCDAIVDGDRLHKQLQDSVTQAALEREAVIKQKDAERKSSVQKVQEECEQDYQQFVSDHQNTLATALQEAREHHDKKTKELQIRHDAELRGLREHLSSSISNESLHRQSLPVLQSTDWENNRLQLMQELAKRDSLLEQADAHIMQEMKKLQEELETAHAQQVQSVTERLELKYHQDYNNAVQELTENLMTNSESKDKNDMKVIKEAVLDKEKVITSLQEQVKILDEKFVAYQCEIDALQNQKKHIIEKLADSERELLSALEDNMHIENINREMEKTYEEDRMLSKQEREEMKGKLEDYKRHAEEGERIYKKSMDELKHSLHNESIVAMEIMKQKMMEVRTNHVEAMEELSKQHRAEKADWSRKLRIQSERVMTSTPVQTESGTENQSILELREQYMDTVGKIKGDVMKHITETNLRASETVKQERNAALRQLKKAYRDAVRNILRTHIVGADIDSKLSSIECTLDLMLGQSNRPTLGNRTWPQSSSSPSEFVQTTTCSTLPVGVGNVPLDETSNIGHGDTSSITATSNIRQIDYGSNDRRSTTKGIELNTVRTRSDYINRHVSLEQNSNNANLEQRPDSDYEVKNNTTKTGLSDGDCPVKCSGIEIQGLVKQSKSNHYIRYNTESAITKTVQSRNAWAKPECMHPGGIQVNSRGSLSDSQSINVNCRTFTVSGGMDIPDTERYEHAMVPIFSKTSGHSESINAVPHINSNSQAQMTKPNQSDQNRFGYHEQRTIISHSNGNLDGITCHRGSLHRTNRGKETKQLPDSFKSEQFGKSIVKVSAPSIARNTKLIDGKQCMQGDVGQSSYKYTPLRESLLGGTVEHIPHATESADCGAGISNQKVELNLNNLGLGNPSPRKFNPIPEKLNSTSEIIAFHEAKISCEVTNVPPNITTRHMSLPPSGGLRQGRQPLRDLMKKD